MHADARRHGLVTWCGRCRVPGLAGRGRHPFKYRWRCLCLCLRDTIPHLSARMCQARCLIVIFTGNMLRSPRKPLHSSLPETASVSSNGRNSETQLRRNSENQRMEQLKCHFWWSRRSCFIDCVGNHGHQRPHHPYRARDCAVRIAWSTREFLARTPRLFDLQGFKPSARGCQSLLDDLQHRCSSVNLHSRLSLPEPSCSFIRAKASAACKCDSSGSVNPRGTSNTNTLQRFFFIFSSCCEEAPQSSLSQSRVKETISRQRSCVCKADTLSGCRYVRADKRSGAAARGWEREEEKVKVYRGNPMRAE